MGKPNAGQDKQNIEKGITKNEEFDCAMMPHDKFFILLILVIHSNYCLRNGGFTTTAFSLRPRMSMQISVPTLLYSGLIYPIPIPILRVGDIVPEVTTPMAVPSVLYSS